MMQMLEAGGVPALTDHVRARDDDNPRGYFELEAVKRTKRDSSWLEAASGRAVKMVHLLLYDLPADRDYQVIFMRRKLEEVVRSQGRMLERRGTSGADLSDEQLKTIERLVHYSPVHGMVEYANTVETKVSRA